MLQETATPAKARSVADIARTPTLPLPFSRRRDDTTLRDPSRTMERARAALKAIGSLGLPADPASFELWYVYAAGNDAALNSAINDAVARGTRLPELLDDIYRRFLAPESLAARIEGVSKDLGEELSQIVGMIDATTVSSARYSDELAGASTKLRHTTDSASLRLLVDELFKATHAVQQQNGNLRIQLQASRQEIGLLQSNLETVCAESRTDALTKIANRKYFDLALPRLMEGSRASGQPLSLLLCDIDHFKSFNDRFGHPVGDHVLRLVAAALKSGIRERDVAARYGGEEFAIVLPDATLDQAKVVGEELCRAIAAKPLMKRSSGQSLGTITVSIGVAQLMPDDTELTFVDRADECLYAAKHTGRNRAVHNTMGQRRGAEAAPSGFPLGR
jgi:diguanylate cyclase